MKAKKAIKRFLLTLMWMGIAVGMFMLIAAAIKVQDTNLCKGYDIVIEGSGDGKLFTSKEQVTALLKAATRGPVRGQSKTVFDLPKIEDLLEQSSWVYNAELYFDNLDILRVKVKEREPLARVFTSLGESFYIDGTGKQIPLSDKITLNVPVITGYPANKIRSAADSALMRNVIATASYINGDPFWTSQVAQLDIRNCGPDCWEMIMIPLVGNHKVNLGDGSDIASKLHRLFLFYDQVLKKKGFDKYQQIDVQYAGQVIGVKDHYSKIDSIQLRKNIENLLQQSRKTNELIEVAPDMMMTSILGADTSGDAKKIYEPVDMGKDTFALMAQGFTPEADNDEKPAAELKAPAKKVVAKQSANAVKKENRETAVPVKADVKPAVKKTAATDKKPETPAGKKVPVKKEAESKQHATVKTAVKPVAKPEVKQSRPGVTTKKSDTKTAAQETAAKPKAKTVVKKASN